MTDRAMNDRLARIVGQMRTIIVGVAGCSPSSVTDDVTFLDLGFDSLSMMQLAAALQDAFGVRITFRQLFDVMPTVAAVARHIERNQPVATEPEAHELQRQSDALASAAAPGRAEQMASAAGNSSRSCAADARLVADAGPLTGTGQFGTDQRPPGRLAPALKMVVLQQLDLMARQLAALSTVSTADPQEAQWAARAATAMMLPAAVPPTSMLAVPAALAQPSPTALLPDAIPVVLPETLVPASIDVPIQPAAGPAPRPAPPAQAHRFATTDSQQELWFTSQLADAASCALNESHGYWIDGPLDADLLATAIETVLARHEALNVRFAEDGESQDYDPAALAGRIRVRHHDFSAQAGDAARQAVEALIAAEARKPFRLATGPLGRIHLVRLGEQRHLLLTYYHHIAYDGYSGGLLMAEIARSYNARRIGAVEPASTALPFSQYVDRLSAHRTPAVIDKALSYWAQLFPELPPPLALPTRADRDSRPNWDGSTVHRELDAARLDAVRALARNHRSTISTVLLAAYQLLLARLSSQDLVVVGIPAAGQVHLGVPCVGYCVNTLPIRSAPGRGKTFETLVRETQAAVLDAIDHQDVSLGALLRARRLVALPGRLPLVEVMFNFSAYQADVDFALCRTIASENRRSAVVYDLFLHVVESADRLILDWDFRTSLFDEATVEGWMSDYVNLIDTLASALTNTRTAATPGSGN